MRRNYNRSYIDNRREQLLNEVADRVVDILYEEYEQGRLDEMDLNKLVRGARNLGVGAAMTVLPFLGHSQTVTKDYHEPSRISADYNAMIDAQKTGKADYTVSQGLRAFPQLPKASSMRSSTYRETPSDWVPLIKVPQEYVDNLEYVEGSDEGHPEGIYKAYIDMYYNPGETRTRSDYQRPKSLADEIVMFPERFEISREGAVDLTGANPRRDTEGRVHVSQIKLRDVNQIFKR